MSTRCKIIFGSKDHMNNWWIHKCFYKHWDGYPEYMLPVLKECKADSNKLQNWEFDDDNNVEEIEFNDFKHVDYLYYIDVNNHASVPCSVLKHNCLHSQEYFIWNYDVVQELIL